MINSHAHFLLPLLVPHQASLHRSHPSFPPLTVTCLDTWLTDPIPSIPTLQTPCTRTAPLPLLFSREPTHTRLATPTAHLSAFSLPTLNCTAPHVLRPPAIPPITYRRCCAPNSGLPACVPFNTLRPHTPTPTSPLSSFHHSLAQTPLPSGSPEVKHGTCFLALPNRDCDGLATVPASST